MAAPKGPPPPTLSHKKWEAPCSYGRHLAMRAVVPKGGSPNIVSTICGGCPPTWGPPTSFHQIRGLPPIRGGHPKTAPPPRKGGCCPPCGSNPFFMRVLSRKIPEGPGTFFRNPPIKFWTCTPKIFQLDCFPLKLIFGYSETLPIFSLEDFQCLRNFSGDFLSDSFPSTQQIDDP